MKDKFLSTIIHHIKVVCKNDSNHLFILQAQLGSIRTIDWRVGTYTDITIGQDTGLLFQWDGAVMHDVVEMSAPVTSADDCSKGQAAEIGLVRGIH